MTPADRKAFVEVVVGFAELKGKQLSAAALELYWRSLQHWPLDEFRKAAEHLLRSCEFMPTPKDFEDLRKAGRPTCGEAWAKAVAACGSCHSPRGYISGGTCGDEFIDRAVRSIGGYRAIAMCDSDKLHFLEKRFAEHFETLQDAQDTRDAVPQLTDAMNPFRIGPPADGPRRLMGGGK
jgi:hypothetical protein